MLIVDPEMGVYVAPDAMEEVTLGFEKGRCVSINGKKVTRSRRCTRRTRSAAATASASRTRSRTAHRHQVARRVRGAGDGALGSALKFLYQAVLDRRATKLFCTSPT